MKPIHDRTPVPARTGGFTLIEVLIVLAIIAALMGIATPLLFTSKATGERAATAAMIQGIKAAVNNRIDSPKFGEAPPTSLAESGFTSTNDTNEGIESLVATLGAEDSVMNPFSDEGRLVNLDGDKDPKRNTFMKSKELFEYADDWGNPLIYFRLRDFENNAAASVRYVLNNGMEIEVGPVKSDKTGAYGGQLDGFQIISLGPDEEFGTDDDVYSWTSN